jgi:glycosyltransferase involved in cell wall biosynthesis
MSPDAKGDDSPTRLREACVAVYTVKRLVCVDGAYWTYGGFGRYLSYLLENFESVILACHPREAKNVPEGYYNIDHPNLEVAWLPYYENEAQCLLRLPLMFIKGFMPAHRSDIVNARVPDFSGIIGAVWARVLGRRLFISHIDNWHDPVTLISDNLSKIVQLGLYLYLRCYSLCEKLICRNTLIFAQGSSAVRIHSGNADVVPLISSSHRSTDIIEEVEVDSEAAVWKVLCIGRLVSAKAHEYAIWAVEELRRQGVNVELHILGEGPRKRELASLVCDSRAAEWLFFHGRVSHKRVFEFLDGVHLLCHPSVSEGTPKVILEAMARGTPVVASRIDGIVDVVEDGKNGILVPPEDVDALVGAVRRLVGNTELRRRLAENALDTARMHTCSAEWGRMIQQLQERWE